MVERWKIEQKRALDRLASAVGKLADEFERYNDRRETDTDTEDQ